jgi:prepilin-type processing-associated H-X9-DG protein
MDEETRTTTEPRPAVPVVEYAPAAPARNRNATIALVWACLAFIPYVAGFLAIRYARRGLADAAAEPWLGGENKARVARLVGVASIVVWVMLTAALVPAAFRAREQSRRVQCLSQLRQVGLGVMMYAAANRGFTPPTFDELIAGGHVPAAMLTCPAAAGDASKPPASSGAYGNYHYVYLGGGRKMASIRRPSVVPLAYELPTNHADARVNVLFFDGHAEVLPAAGLAAVLAAAVPVPPPATQPATPSATQPASPATP